jgi:hypothetical protein
VQFAHLAKLCHAHFAVPIIIMERHYVRKTNIWAQVYRVAHRYLGLGDFTLTRQEADALFVMRFAHLGEFSHADVA